MNIGWYIKDVIKKQGRLQNWVADQLGINEKTFNWKLNHNSLTAEDLLKLSIVLNIDLEELKRVYKEEMENGSTENGD